MSDTGSGLVEVSSAYRCRFCKCFTPIRTAVSLLTILVVWFSSIGSLLTVSSFPFGIYLAFVGIPLFLLEAGYVIRLCCRVDGVCCRVFTLILNFDGIRRGLLYLFSATFCFYSNLTELSIVPGIFLALTAVLYLLKPIQLKKIVLTHESESNVQSVRRTLA